MRAFPLYFAIPTAIPGAALAHAGHVADLAGHSHWVAGAAVGAAVAIAAWAALKGRRKTEPEDTISEPDGQEA